MTELRRDPVIGRWVIISTDRGKRPSDFGQEVETGVGKFCPFCPGQRRQDSCRNFWPITIRAARRNPPGWWVRVVPNKFPALQIEGSLSTARAKACTTR